MIGRPSKTAADYMAIAVCPGLIMVFVGSLVMFMLQVSYSGAFLARLQWTLFWFVFAMVLVSRIAIEQSEGAAFLYGLALAMATSVMLTQYIGFIWGVWLLLGVIWWVSNKLVWDCTLIDDDQDASGQGLLQATRFQHWLRLPSTQVRAVPSPAAALAPPLPRIPTRPKKPNTARERALQRKAKSQDVHSPGLWILYFSLAAVPVFGGGELLLAQADAAGRRIGFLLLGAYLASGLLLLLLTSFLGLRRYLRQRHIVMPPALAATWISTGLVLTGVCLSLALLLPRPATPYSLSGLAKLGSPAPADSEGRTSSRAGENGRGEGGGSEARPESTAETPSESASQGGNARGSGAARGSRETAQVESTSRGAGLQLERWISFLVAVAALGLGLVWFWPQIKSALELLRRRRETRLPRFPGRQRRFGSAERVESRLRADPFQTGAAERMSLAELVRYSYEGVQRWAESRGTPLVESETPLEYAERLSEKEPALEREVLLLANYFSHVTYANQEPPEEALRVLRRLWNVIGFRK